MYIYKKVRCTHLVTLLLFIKTRRVQTGFKIAVRAGAAKTSVGKFDWLNLRSMFFILFLNVAISLRWILSIFVSSHVFPWICNVLAPQQTELNIFKVTWWSSLCFNNEPATDVIQLNVLGSTLAIQFKYRAIQSWFSATKVVIKHHL